LRGRSAPAHVQRQPDIVQGVERRKQMVGLKDEADIVASEPGKAAGRAPLWNGRRCARS